MKLLTKEIRNALPPMGSTDNDLDARVIVKFFSPYSNWTWWAFEGEPVLDDDGTELDFYFYGLVKGFETELGTWSLSEMESARRGRLPLVERDMYYNDPITKHELFAKHYPIMLKQDNITLNEGLDVLKKSGMKVLVLDEDTDWDNLPTLDDMFGEEN